MVADDATGADVIADPEAEGVGATVGVTRVRPVPEEMQLAPPG